MSHLEKMSKGLTQGIEDDSHSATEPVVAE